MLREQSFEDSKDMVIFEKSFEFLDRLMASGFHVDDSFSCRTTLIHYAAEAHRSDLVEILANMYGADLNVRTKAGETPLFLAGLQDFDSMDIFKTLLRHGACIGVKDEDGNTFLHFAVDYCEIVLMDLMFSSEEFVERSNALEIFFNDRNYAGKTAADMVLANGPEFIAHIKKLIPEISNHSDAKFFPLISIADSDKITGGNEQRCSLCKEKFTICELYKSVLMILPCKHTFHSHCMRPLLKCSDICPTCSKPIFK